MHPLLTFKLILMIRLIKSGSVKPLGNGEIVEDVLDDAEEEEVEEEDKVEKENDVLMKENVSWVEAQRESLRVQRLISFSVE